MLKRKKLIYILSLILAAMLLLSSCTTTNYSCATYPTAGEKVAEELKNVPYEGYEDTWEWLGRIEKLKRELDLCQKRLK